MFRIDFDRNSMRAPSEKQMTSLGSTSEMNLRYAHFETNVQLAAEGLDESFRIIPILDFMFCLILAAEKVRHGETGEVDFTENSAFITFQPTGSSLTILCSWNPAPGRCSTDEFIHGILQFATEGLEFIVGKYPAFAENPTRHKLLAMKTRLESGLECQSH
ncbi:hypothetical protein [Kitasatospora sp. NBC_01300]|uniref:hypothetical protein n=1 Tax=Kitasatospora sp. NBC_01300 TaxID=2903574 RepID=UPI002F9182FD|nr:hypothetical protein OG556_39490 [Kitasatospora sp. NBC_01300]